MGKKIKILVSIALSATVISLCTPISDSLNFLGSSTVIASADTDEDSSSAYTSISNLANSYTDFDLKSTYSEADASTITFSNDSVNVSGDGVTCSDNVVKITEAGTYVLSGTSTNYRVKVSADDADVVLVFKNLNITYADESPISITSASNTAIILANGTNNTVTDNGTNYSDDNERNNSAIYAKCPLTINGTGTLNVNANYNYGIFSKNVIKFVDGNVNVTSVGDSVKAKDSFTMRGGDLTVNSADVGIHSTYYMDIENGNVNVTTTGTEVNESDSDSSSSSSGGWNPWGGSSSSGSNQDGYYKIASKGIKSGSDMYFNNANVTVNSTGHAVQAEGTLTVAGSDTDLNLNAYCSSMKANSKGMTADGNLYIQDGDIDITQSYEGIESKSTIYVSGGDTTIVSSDDGFNAGTGITMTDGYVYTNASGDSIDSNAAINISGGTLLAVGPNSGGNSCLDSESGLTFTGGTVLGVSSSQSMWSEDVIGKITGSYIYNTSAGSINNSTIAVTDSTGNVLSILKLPISGSMGVVYMNGNVSDLTSCKFVIGGTYSATYNEDGYAEGGTVTGGTTATVNSGSNASGGGSNPSGGGNQPGGGGRPSGGGRH